MLVKGGFFHTISSIHSKIHIMFTRKIYYRNDISAHQSNYVLKRTYSLYECFSYFKTKYLASTRVLLDVNSFILFHFILIFCWKEMTLDVELLLSLLTKHAPHTCVSVVVASWARSRWRLCCFPPVPSACLSASQRDASLIPTQFPHIQAFLCVNTCS